MPRKHNKPITNCTKDRLSIVVDVLSGNDPDGISLVHAARKTGLSLPSLTLWIQRAETPRPGDPDLTALAYCMTHRNELLAGRYEDLMHQRIMKGTRTVKTIQKPDGDITTTITVKDDNRPLLKMLQRRDPHYANQPPPEEKVDHELTPEEKQDMMQRLIALKRLIDADALAQEDLEKERQAETRDRQPGRSQH